MSSFAWNNILINNFVTGGSADHEDDTNDEPPGTDLISVFNP